MCKTGTRLLAAVLCAVAMLGALAGCQEDVPAGSELTGPVDTDPVKPGPTPLQRLSAAVDATGRTWCWRCGTRT